MTLETSIDNLAAAINALASAVAAGQGLPLNAPAEPEAPRRGRPRKDTDAPAPSAPAPAAPPPPAAAAPSAPPAPAAAPPPPPAAPAPPAAAPSALDKSGAIDKAAVQAALIRVVKEIGRQQCTDLCTKHGGPNLSSLDPKVYPAIYAEAIQMLEAAAV